MEASLVLLVVPSADLGADAASSSSRGRVSGDPAAVPAAAAAAALSASAIAANTGGSGVMRGVCSKASSRRFLGDAEEGTGEELLLP